MLMVLGRLKKYLYFVAKEQKVNREGLVTSHKLFKETTAVTLIPYIRRN